VKWLRLNNGEDNPVSSQGEALSAAPVYGMGLLGLALSVWAIAVALSRL
jgi:hypothetical protein